MFLKGFLCRTVSVEDLKHRYGHFLNRLWQAFKAETGDASLNVFDGTVAALDAFAELRYPSEDGFTVQFALEGPINPASGPAGSRTFGLVIRDLDTLVQVIIRHAAITPEFLVMSMSAEGRAALARDNATGIWPP
jgi:hypothetical protein